MVGEVLPSASEICLATSEVRLAAKLWLGFIMRYTPRGRFTSLGTLASSLFRHFVPYGMTGRVTTWLQVPVTKDRKDKVKRNACGTLVTATQ